MGREPQPREPWVYLSFTDRSRPKGSRWLGGCFVRVSDEHREEDEAAAQAIAGERELGANALLLARAVRQSHRLGINLGGQVLAMGPLCDEELDAHVPEADRARGWRVRSGPCHAPGAGACGS